MRGRAPPLACDLGRREEEYRRTYKSYPSLVFVSRLRMWVICGLSPTDSDLITEARDIGGWIYFRCVKSGVSYLLGPRCSLPACLTSTDGMHHPRIAELSKNAVAWKCAMLFGIKKPKSKTEDASVSGYYNLSRLRSGI